MTHELNSPSTAGGAMASLFADAPGLRLALGVRDDKAFAPGRHLRLGSVRLSPPADSGDLRAACAIAVANGFYDLELTDVQAMRADLRQALPVQDPGKLDRQATRADRALGLLPAALVRVGLMHPAFDVDALGLMPFTAPATVIMDTSAIIEGGLDFAARFLCPFARIKVPGIVHMELVNDVDNYFSLRREAPIKAPGEAFASHAKGLAGQATLLRLEFQAGMEVERSSIFQDPLRHAFSKGETDSSMNVTAPVRSYCDRLILEAGRLHQAQVSPGHPVHLMTADQGLARMALAEGFSPIFCEAARVEALLPTVLPGTVFHPFSGALYGVPLTSLVWELATACGSVILEREDGAVLEVTTLGDALSWQTFHVRQGLRWVRAGARLSDLVGDPAASASAAAPVAAPRRPRAPKGSEGDGRDAAGPHREETASVAREARPAEPSRQARGEGTNFNFSAGGLLSMVGQLIEAGTSDRQRLAQAGGVRETGLDGYLGFLRAGGFAQVDGKLVTATDGAMGWFDAMRTRDFRRTCETLRRVPSFDAFLRDLDARRIVEEGDLRRTLFWRMPNYRRYAEACGRALLIRGEGLHATPSDPAPDEFVAQALDAFEKTGGGEYVLTGAWLEELARRGIHPLVARDKLQQAHSMELVERFTRGATPDTRFEGHEFHAFEPDGGSIKLATVRLYHGQFLLPERASVELSLRRRAA